MPSNGIEWVKIVGGPFMMGQPPTSACTTPGCVGQTSVYVKSFLLMKYEMTKSQRASLAPPQPWTSCPSAGTCPAAQVTWKQAAMACNALSIKEGLNKCYDDITYSSIADLTKCGYRLPTRAEFEYAYRAGTTTEFYNGPASPTQCVGATKAALIGWYDWNSGGSAQPVGQKDPNAWGLYDMAGNVREWLHDSCVNSQGKAGKIVMGGSFNSSSPATQAGSYYCENLVDVQSSLTGLRCARSL